MMAAGLLLLSCFPAEAQIPPKEIVLAQISPIRTIIRFRAPQVRFSPTVLLIPPSRMPTPRSTFILAPAYKSERSLENRLQIEKVRTPFVTDTSYPIAHWWPGLQLDAFESTRHSQSPQLGSPASGTSFLDPRPLNNHQAELANSVRSDGIRLSYSFGRDAEARKSVQIWRCVLWVIGNPHGCPLHGR